MKKILVASVALAALAVGSLTAADDAAGDKPKGKPDPSKRADMMIKKGDKDADGKLSAAELTAVFEAAPKRPDAPEGKTPDHAARAAKMIETGDKDGDSLLNKEELVASMAKGKGKGKGEKPAGKKPKTDSADS